MRVHEASVPTTPRYPGPEKKRVPPELDFHQRLVPLRKVRGLTQQALPNLVVLNISPIRRCESGQSQPTLDAIRKQFHAASRLDPEKKNVSRSAIESIVLRNTFKAAERRFTDGVTTR
jgi:predicted transcriptional regulator